MSIYNSLVAFENPVVYRDSGQWLREEDERGGFFDVAHPPGEAWLRISVNDACVLLDPEQSKELAQRLTEWLATRKKP